MRAPVTAALLAASVRWVTALRERRSAVGRNDQKVSRFLGDVPVFEILSEQSPDKEWLVFFNDGCDDNELEMVCKQADISCKVMGHPSGGGIPFIAAHSSEEVLSNALNVSSNVKFVAPDYNLKPDLDPSPGDIAIAGAQLARNPGVLSDSDTWHLDRVGTPDSTGRGVNVYVFDSGVKSDHDEFEGRAIPTLQWSAKLGKEFECKESHKSCATDQIGHGTHVAGIVGGKEYGVAPDVTIRILRMDFSTADNGVSVAYSYLDWLIRNKESPAVLQMSFGWLEILPGSLEAVDKVLAAGITVVVAAGNFATDACTGTWAHIPGVIAVAASDSADNHVMFSNHGKCVDLYAPGYDVKAASWFGTIESKSGTSMAAPMVSGAAALLLEKQPWLTPAQVKEALLKNAEKGKIKGVPADTPNLLLSVGPKQIPIRCEQWCSWGDYCNHAYYAAYCADCPSCASKTM